MLNDNGFLWNEISLIDGNFRNRFLRCKHFAILIFNLKVLSIRKENWEVVPVIYSGLHSF